MGNARLKYRDIEIRGVVYPDAKAAAAALGITAKAVRRAVRDGRLDAVGLKGNPVTIRGRSFPSYAAAGRALGVTAETVGKAVAAGTLHRVGTGRAGWEPRPVRINGKVYESAAKAAHALGVKRCTIYEAIAQGREDRVGMRRPPCMIKARPFVIAGMQFESMAAASRAIGKYDGYVGKVQRIGSKAERENMMARFMALAAERDSLVVRRRVRHA